MIIKTSEIDYSEIIDKGIRYIIKLALIKAQDIDRKKICFVFKINTECEDLIIPDYLKHNCSNSITLILQYQFEDLVVNDDCFCVKLNFSGNLENVVIPFKSIIYFNDKFANIEFSIDDISDINDIQILEQYDFEDFEDLLDNNYDDYANNNCDIHNNIINFSDLEKIKRK